MAKKSKCSPAIYRKFTPYQQKVWDDLYNTFLFPAHFHSDWESKKNKEQQEVTAHNMACEAVWYMRDNPSELEMLLDEMPDHFCERGKKTEYSLVITKDKKGKYQIMYANINKDIDGKKIVIDSYSDDKNYPLLKTAIEQCKKYLFTRNWKKL